MSLERDEIKYQKDGFSPSNLSKSDIEAYAEKVAGVGKFKPGGSLIDFTESFGGRIHYQDFSNWLTESGSIYVHARYDFDIFIPQYTSTKRDRFTIAHELGHYFLHSNQGATPLVANRNGENKRVEWEANWFAAALLMPSDEFKTAFNQLCNLESVALLFEVSGQAAKIRAEVLGLVQG